VLLDEREAFGDLAAGDVVDDMEPPEQLVSPLIRRVAARR